MNGNPTVVVWALGSSFNKEAEVDEQLKALNQVLSENDAFITYQMTDTPSATLQNYATKFIPAGETDEISAAYAYTTGSAETDLRTSQIHFTVYLNICSVFYHF